MHGRNTQVARIYRILNLLEGSPQGLSATELRERLGERDVEVSKRTIYRDLEALSDAGFPLFPNVSPDHDRDEGATRWVLERGAKINQYLVFTAQELFALYLARGMLVQHGDSPLHSDLEGVFRKIADKLGTVNREHFTELASEIRFDTSPNWGLGLKLEVLDAVRAACAEGQVLTVDYESVSSGTKSRRRLGPHYVYFTKGMAYLIAEDLATGESKVFALPRMANAVMEDEASLSLTRDLSDRQNQGLHINGLFAPKPVADTFIGEMKRLETAHFKPGMRQRAMRSRPARGSCRS